MSTIRSTARATRSSAEPKGATVATSACATAANTNAGASVDVVSSSASPVIRADTPFEVLSRPRSLVGTWSKAASVWARARACPGATRSTPASVGSSVESRTAPAIDRCGSSVSWALARAPASRADAMSWGSIGPEPTIGQHHVDGRAGRGEARWHALQPRQIGQRVGHD